MHTHNTLRTHFIKWLWMISSRIIVTSRGYVSLNASLFVCLRQKSSMCMSVTGCVCVPCIISGCDRVLTAVAEKCRASVRGEWLLSRAVQGPHWAVGPQCTAAAFNLGAKECVSDTGGGVGVAAQRSHNGKVTGLIPEEATDKISIRERTHALCEPVTLLRAVWRMAGD